MRNILTLLIPWLLTGCINVYGPAKMGGSSEQSSAQPTPGMGDIVSTISIGNRKPEELLNAVELYYQQKGLTPSVRDIDTGVVAAAGHDDELTNLFLDCSMLPQTQNIQEQYRIVTQVWSAGEGSNVSVSVTGTAGLVTADGNDKVKAVECKSTGAFEKDLLERLRK
ncbi:hypothetical protein [Enterobacter hormaechei]|uniref:hypothetical protein n=1 Tax=Enterobacter hormaechei TaxID=158836 RepID=UPI000735DBBC|nr:hypothetical protein ASU89_20675 [Enterobacter hormaechei subsp. steigerwaltii]MBE9457015.1 hypothetical protein [Enterobacter hormaechei]MBF1964671.1 hypothetical protein [Enterobacter hormaechei]HAV1618609.1 hypothetical protein [Enterobacter hormaechei subsp. steigerwaltii]HAV1918199.1 hypothetical protein [Enterobacter hormaechei subsp. steigerwaltii]